MDIYRLALGIAKVPIDQVLYIDDRLMFVEVAQSLGIHSVHHTVLNLRRSSEFSRLIREKLIAMNCGCSRMRRRYDIDY
jgi:FMN phosphatase YigB (HAD superfamily)